MNTPLPSELPGKNDGLLSHFPLTRPRAEQIEALETLKRIFEEENKKFCIFELPTGGGKSAIALTGLRWQERGYVLSPQKSLTAQYMRDFERIGLAELRGKTEYICRRLDTGDMNCSVSSSLYPNHEEFCEGHEPALSLFKRSPLSVTNYACFLTHPFDRRPLLVLDEGHNIESQVLNFISSTLSRDKCEQAFELRLPIFEKVNDVEAVRDFLHSLYAPKLDEKIKKLAAEIHSYRDNLAKALSGFVKERLTSLVAERSDLKRRLDNVHLFLEDDPTDWFVRSDWDPVKKTGTGNLIIKPLSCVRYVRKKLFNKGNRVLIMSATILDPAFFARSLGIGAEEFGFRAWESSFPVNHRPIYYQPVAYMNYKNREKSLPRMVRRVVELVASYPDVKGIIHTQSYQNTYALVTALYEAGLGNRVLTHNKSPRSREEVLAIHRTSPKPTVLLSPGMTEGLDFSDALSRFQIIIKVPYADLSDPYVKARMRRDETWYRWNTALALIQATGRSVRSQSDHADTYILDACFEGFVNGNSSLFPDWWRDAITTS